MSGLFANAQPVQGLAGGVLIGLAAALMLLGAGRIAGVSGITARASGIVRGGMSMSSAWAFLIGLPLGGSSFPCSWGGHKSSSPLGRALAWRARSRMTRPLFGERFSLPDRGDLDNRLMAGAALFGIGWGIAGLCPGPAVASLALAPSAVLPFVIAMLAGMAIHRLIPESLLRTKIQGISV